MSVADQPKILLLDSARSEALLAISTGERVLAEQREQGQRFSAHWPRLLQNLLDEASLHLRDLNALAVVSGPGSFTGVRVGLALSLGLAEAVGLPIITVSALELLQASCAAPCIAAIDAGRGQWFVRDGLGEESLVEPDVLSVMTREQVVVAEAGSLAKLPDGVQALPFGRDATQLAAVAKRRWQQGRLVDTLAVEANYVRGERQIYPAPARSA